MTPENERDFNDDYERGEVDEGTLDRLLLSARPQVPEVLYTLTAGDGTPLAYTKDEILDMILPRAKSIRECEEQIVTLQAIIDARKAQLLPMLVALGGPVTVGGLDIDVQMPREEVVYAATDLDALTKADRYKYGFLTRFRSLRVHKGGVVVK